MSVSVSGRPTPEQRKRLLVAFQLVGLLDIALGVAVAAIGPDFVGGEPLVDKILMVCGVLLATGGLAMVWFARRRFGTPRDKPGTESIFKVDG